MCGEDEAEDDEEGQGGGDEDDEEGPRQRHEIGDEDGEEPRGNEGGAEESPGAELLGSSRPPSVSAGAPALRQLWSSVSISVASGAQSPHKS